MCVFVDGVYIQMFICLGYICWYEQRLLFLFLLLFYFTFILNLEICWDIRRWAVLQQCYLCVEVLYYCSFKKKLKAILIFYFISSILFFHIFYALCPYIYCLYISQELQVMIDPWISWNTVNSQRSRRASCILVSINCLNSQPKARFIFIMR